MVRPSPGRSRGPAWTADDRLGRPRTGGRRTPARSATGAAGQPVDSTPGRSTDPGSRPALVDIRTVAHLIPAARAARAALAADGRSLSRDALANAMRDDGHGVSNVRASLLLKILKAEEDATPFGAATAGATGSNSDRRPDVAA